MSFVRLRLGTLQLGTVVFLIRRLLKKRDCFVAILLAMTGNAFSVIASNLQNRVEISKRYLGAFLLGLPFRVFLKTKLYRNTAT